MDGSEPLMPSVNVSGVLLEDAPMSRHLPFVLEMVLTCISIMHNQLEQIIKSRSIMKQPIPAPLSSLQEKMTELRKMSRSLILFAGKYHSRFSPQLLRKLAMTDSSLS